ncbi:hypothetical protein DC522_24625 [Microvirga sp. KLBC 81]|uniref:hypothetical protein n=1 Tax=Microvirga sp. KLBC 81 TaxID=1862707 RepID=UPI000D5246C3|nr:hypothetical protein [Microvirga sp. KLBC 81]PVE21803.1 hypothetical protein DC522_24625 [Microvirga sp. KLBC 81]
MIEPIGFATITIGVLCMLIGQRAASSVLIVTTLLGSAAAILIGSINIQPAHLFLAFVASVTFTHRREAAAAIEAITPPKPGFWLACLVFYGVISGFLLPRLLAGSTFIVPLGTSEYAGKVVPLGPVSSNLTQSVYLAANLACFTMIVAIASTRGGFEAVTKALIAYAAVNALFAFLDLGTYATETQRVLDFMRNARYTLHHEEEVAGLKRIVGSFTEASSFARSTLGALGFTGTLWLCGHYSAWTGPLALISLGLVVLSTSSTGLAGVFPVMLMLYVTALQSSGLHASRRNSAAVALFAPPLVLLALIVVLLDAETSATIREYFNVVVLNKSTTHSGIERSSWNTLALQNFFDSWGFGVGLGTSRTSSILLALLSNVGLPGLIFYGLFTASAFRRRHGTVRSFPFDVRLAARNACLSLLVGDLMASPTVDQGLLFYILAGLASAEPEFGAASRTVGVHGRLLEQ